MPVKKKVKVKKLTIPTSKLGAKDKKPAAKTEVKKKTFTAKPSLKEKRDYLSAKSKAAGDYSPKVEAMEKDQASKKAKLVAINARRKKVGKAPLK
jgi:hypothetical protein